MKDEIDSTIHIVKRGEVINELKLEVFPSNQPVQACAFHVYNLISSNLTDSPFKVIRGACRTLANCNASIGIFENGKQILSTAEISNIPEKGVDFLLEYQGKHPLDVLRNKRVYEAYIRFLIREKLKTRMFFDKYRKYRCKSVGCVSKQTVVVPGVRDSSMDM